MATQRVRLAVHPGWLTMDRAPIPKPAGEQADNAVKFNAFMHVIRTASALDRAAADALADLDLTVGAFSALVELANVGDAGIAPSELARRLAVARRTATLYVEVLATHGWATREAHPEDRRMVIARVTPAGRDLLRLTGSAYQSRLGALMGDMTCQQALLLGDLLSMVLTDRDAAGRPGAGEA